MTASVNSDKNSINYGKYGLYVPSGQYGVQLWQNSIPSDARPECNASALPFAVATQADQVQDFSSLVLSDESQNMTSNILFHLGSGD